LGRERPNASKLCTLAAMLTGQASEKHSESKDLA